MLEKHWRQTVSDAARRLNWRVYFTWNSIHSPAGFPDLVLLRPPRLIFAELKTDKGKPTDAQVDWLTTLHLIEGVETYLWKPKDWDTVLEILT